MEIKFQLFHVKQLYTILSSAEEFESKILNINQMLQKASISLIYELIVFFQSILLSNSQLPITKYNTLTTILQLQQKSRYQSVKFIQIFILPILIQISSYSFNLRKSQDIQMYFIEKGYNNTAGMRKISRKYILLASEIILFSAIINPYQNVLTEEISIISKYLEARQQLENHGVQIPDKYQNNELASFRQKYTQNFNKINTSQFANFIIKVVSQQILVKRVISPSIMKLIQSGDAFITIPLINSCVEMFVKIQDQFSYKKYYLMLLNACIKQGDVYAIIILHNNSFIAEIFQEISKIKGNQNISYGKYIYPQIEANQLQKLDFYIQFLKSLQIWATCLPQNEIGQISQVRQFYLILKQKRQFIFPVIIMLDNIKYEFNENLYKNESRNDELLRLLQSNQQLFTKLFKKDVSDVKSIVKYKLSSSQLKDKMGEGQHEVLLKLVKEMNKMFDNLSRNAIDPNVTDLSQYSRQWDNLKDKSVRPENQNIINQGNQLSLKFRQIHPLFVKLKKKQITAQSFRHKINKILSSSFDGNKILPHQSYDDYGMKKKVENTKNMTSNKKQTNKSGNPSQKQINFSGNYLNEEIKQLGHQSRQNIFSAEQKKILDNKKNQNIDRSSKKNLTKMQASVKKISVQTTEIVGSGTKGKKNVENKEHKIMRNGLNSRQNKLKKEQIIKYNKKIQQNDKYRIKTQEQQRKIDLKKMKVEQQQALKKQLLLKDQQKTKQAQLKIKIKQQQKAKLRIEQLQKQKRQQQLKNYEKLLSNSSSDYNLIKNKLKNLTRIEKKTKDTSNSFEQKQEIQQFDKLMSKNTSNNDNESDHSLIKNYQKHRIIDYGRTFKQEKQLFGIHDVYQVYQDPKSNRSSNFTETGQNIRFSRDSSNRDKLQFQKKNHLSLSRSIESYSSYVNSCNSSQNSSNTLRSSTKSIIKNQYRKLNLKSLTRTQESSQQQNIINIFDLNSSKLIQSIKLQETCYQFQMDSYYCYFPPLKKSSIFIKNCVKMKGVLLDNQDFEIGFVNIKKEDTLEFILFITAKKNISALRIKVQSDDNLQITNQAMDIRSLQQGKQQIFKIQVSIKNIPYVLPLLNIKIKPKGEKSKLVELYLPCTFNKFCIKNIQTNNNLLFRYKQDVKSFRSKDINFQQKIIKKGLINILFNNPRLQNDSKRWKAQYQWQNNGFILQFTQKDKNNGQLTGIGNIKVEKQLQFLLSTCYFILEI